MTVYVDKDATLFRCPACGVAWQHKFVMKYGWVTTTCCGVLLRTNPMPFPAHVMGRSGAW